MSVNGKVNDTFIASNDLDSYQYTIQVNSIGKYTDRAGTAGAATAGVLQNKPQAGEHATVTILGKTRIFAGGTITAGAGFTTTVSGTATTVASGDYELGRSVTGVASGGLFEGVVTHAGVTIVA